MSPVQGSILHNGLHQVGVELWPLVVSVLAPPGPPAPPTGLRLAGDNLWPLLAAGLVGQPPTLDRRTAMRALALGILLVALASTPAPAIDFTVSASVVSAAYTEPTQNADGSALVDLAHTSVYYQIPGQAPVKSPAIPASAPTGGGSITAQISVPLTAGQEATVDFWATATDLSGNESVPSTKVPVRIDRLAPKPPQ